MTTPQELASRPVGAAESPALIPLVDVFEDAQGITVTADMPGASKESLAVDINGDTLTIDASFSLGEPPDTQPTYTEVRASRYRRSFTLSRELDTARVQAVLRDGVLTLRLPKLEQARPRRIDVQAA